MINFFIKGFKISCFFTGIVLISITSYSQISPGLFLFPDNFRGQITNPAFFRTDEAQILALPGFAGLSLNHAGSFRFTDILQLDVNDRVVVDLEHFGNLAPKKNQLTQNALVPLLYYSAPFNDGVFSFYINEKIYHSLQFESQALSWFAKGNLPAESRVYNTGNINFNLLGFKEIAAGYGFSLNDYINVGFRGKLLLGESYFDVEDWNYTFATSANGNEIEISTFGSANVSSPLWFKKNENGEVEKIRVNNFLTNYIAVLKNPGVAIDLGIDMRISRNSEIAASISDVGMIFFQNNAHYLSQNDSYLFKGFDVSNSLGSQTDNYTSPYNVVISTQNRMGAVLLPEAQEQNFSRFIIPGMFLQYKYSYSNSTYFSISNQTYFQKNNIYNLLSAGLLQKWNTLSVYAIVSSTKFRYLSLGGGFQYTTQFGQFFFATDNILAAFHLANQRSFTFSLGMNFLINYFPPGPTSNKFIPFGNGKTSKFRPFFRNKN